MGDSLPKMDSGPTDEEPSIAGKSGVPFLAKHFRRDGVLTGMIVNSFKLPLSNPCC
jgi:hypothetical protein